MSWHSANESKFPGSTASDLGEVNIGPGPSTLNPAGVYPESALTSDPQQAERKARHGARIATALENPYELEQVLQRLHGALADALDIFQREGQATDVTNDGTKKAYGFSSFSACTSPLFPFLPVYHSLHHMTELARHLPPLPPPICLPPDLLSPQVPLYRVLTFRCCLEISIDLFSHWKKNVEDIQDGRL